MLRCEKSKGGCRLKVLKRLNEHAEEAIMCILLALMVILMVIQVFMRRVMGATLSWSEEVTRYFFVWSVFLSVSFTLRNNSAMKLDVILAIARKAVKKIVVLLSQAAMLIFFGYMTVVAYDVVVTTVQTSATLGISMKWIYASTLLGFALSVIRLIQLLIHNIRHFRDDDAEKTEGGEDVAG